MAVDIILLAQNSSSIETKLHLAMSTPDRADLIRLADELRDARYNGLPDEHLMAQLGRVVDDSEAGDLCWTFDTPTETIVDYWLGYNDAKRKLTRAEFIQLVDTMRGPGPYTEADSFLFHLAFDFNCINPAKDDLIYCPAQHFDGNMNPRSEEIVSKALSG